MPEVPSYEYLKNILDKDFGTAFQKTVFFWPKLKRKLPNSTVRFFAVQFQLKNL